MEKKDVASELIKNGPGPPGTDFVIKDRLNKLKDRPECENNNNNNNLSPPLSPPPPPSFFSQQPAPPPPPVSVPSHQPFLPPQPSTLPPYQQNFSQQQQQQQQQFLTHSTALRCESFLKKASKKKHVCRHGKNYYYFCKSNIPVINLAVGSRNMIKLSKNMSL